MNRNRVILILQAAVCVLLAVLLAAGAVCICLDGLARKAENPLENVYTPENTAGLITAAIPLLIIFFVLLAIGLALGVKDPGADRPAGPSGPVKPAAGTQNSATEVRAIISDIPASIATRVKPIPWMLRRRILTKSSGT